MNPSARGWIDKLLTSLFHNKDYSNLTFNELYNSLRQTGFIYGSSIGVVREYIINNDLTTEECGKLFKQQSANDVR